MARIESFNTSSSDGTGLQSRAQGQTQAAVGQFAGQQVLVDDADSMLADAAEEISMHHAEKVESRHSAERRKEGRRSLETISVEAIMAYMDAAKACDEQDQLALLARRMLSGQGDPAQLARQAFGEPTSQFMALHYALQQGERDGVAREVLEELREVLQDLEMVQGPAIRADINTQATAAEAGATRVDIAQFQAAYRDVVLGESSLAGTLKLALERFGDQDFAVGLQRLTQALGQDIAAAQPSCAPARLQTLLSDLFQLGIVATVLDGCKTLQTMLAQKYHIVGMSPVVLMSGLVDLSAEKWASAQRFTSLSERCGVRDAEPQVQFLTAVKGLLRDMPERVFATTEQRQSVFSAAQDALDAAIDREEEEY
ncbi:type III secretion system gatekeeper subunit SctW [Pantoea sp. 18069]|uniref:type III secretion system gatekeeper subunit SctW n=1 Tax=Pantoea sp. 18069 TaxID=2681415 RepID=UPI001357E42F|nr:type III secretion system gatekeeper subunit SctW [Pantoea sp. 18069]